MLSTLFYAGLVLATSALARPSAAGDAAFKTMQAHQLVFHPLSIVRARIDPIISPGINKTSGHVHTVIGPDVFNSNSTTDQLRDGNCTSMVIGDNLDMSAYWQPSIYHIGSDGKFTLLNLSFTAVYYNMYHTQPMRAFPDGFGMVTGNATATPTDGLAPVDGYITACNADLGAFPRRYCDRVGYHAQFPDCHDGEEFTKETQHLHMRFSKNGACEPGWIKYPAIMLEFMYNAGPESLFPANPSSKPTYVFSNGDAVGSTGHADFLNGWQPGALQKVIDQCSSLGFGNTANCPVLKSHLGRAVETAAHECRYSQALPDEDIGAVAPAKSLPGCVKVRDGTKTAVGNGIAPAPSCPAVQFI